MTRIVTAFVRAQSDLSSDPDAARKAAKDILSGKDYRDEQLARPFTKQTSWLGEQLDRLGRLVSKFFDAIPGGPVIDWALLVGLGAFAVIVLVRMLGRRSWRRKGVPVERTVDVGAIEHAADDAEARGDHALAVELRFRAGIARLDHDTRIPAQRRTNATLQPTLHDDFCALGTTFDAVHYGSRTVGPEASGAARTKWPVVLETARDAQRQAKTRVRRRTVQPAPKRPGSAR